MQYRICSVKHTRSEIEYLKQCSGINGRSKQSFEDGNMTFEMHEYFNFE